MSEALDVLHNYLKSNTSGVCETNSLAIEMRSSESVFCL